MKIKKMSHEQFNKYCFSKKSCEECELLKYNCESIRSYLRSKEYVEKLNIKIKLNKSR